MSDEKNASEIALDEIAAACGCPRWEYPGQVTRDVLRIVASRDDAADAFDRLVARVWRAATGDTHEGPASVEALLAAVEGLRADLADTRAALRAHLHCDECEELATRTHAETASFGCDAHGIGEGWSDTTHAAAVRAAMEGGR